jgi:hypothetical protein
LGMNTKIWLAAYPRPGKPDLPTGDCKLHNLGCRYLKPTPSRPYTRPKRASPAEQVRQPKCLVC